MKGYSCLVVFCVALIVGSLDLVECSKHKLKFTDLEWPSDEIDPDPGKTAPWTPVDWKTLPKALPTDEVELWYLVAPLLETDVGKLLATLNLYHGAVAFINKRTGFNITINYDAFDFFRSSLFPIFVTYPNGTKGLEWVDGGGSFIYMSINESYWISYQYKLATMNGSVYNSYISQWNSQVNSTHPFYSMIGVTSGPNGTTYLPSYDCFDFSWQTFNYLYQMGAQFNYSQFPYRDTTTMYATSPPTKVTSLYYSDPRVRNEIIEFYEILEVQLSGISWTSFILTILEAFEGKFYFYYQTDYYQVSLQYPFFGLDWFWDPLPGQPNFSPPISKIQNQLKREFLRSK